MAPDCVSMRTWLSRDCAGASSSGFWAVVEKVEGRRWRDVGKWPVWKEDLFTRRWPPREVGSGLG